MEKYQKLLKRIHARDRDRILSVLRARAGRLVNLDVLKITPSLFRVRTGNFRIFLAVTTMVFTLRIYANVPKIPTETLTIDRAYWDKLLYHL